MGRYLKKTITGALSGVFAAALLLFASGCAVSLETALMEIRENPSSGAFIPDVPFYPQEKFMCGPASLASVMAFYGDSSGRYVESVADTVYKAELRGTLPLDLVVYAKDQGYDAVFYDGSMDDLREKIGKRRPLILFLNVGYKSAPVGHYVVVTGYNDKHKTIIMHNGLGENETHSYDWLINRWSLTGYSTILLTPRAK